MLGTEGRHIASRYDLGESHTSGKMAYVAASWRALCLHILHYHEFEWIWRTLSCVWSLNFLFGITEAFINISLWLQSLQGQVYWPWWCTLVCQLGVFLKGWLLAMVVVWFWGIGWILEFGSSHSLVQRTSMFGRWSRDLVLTSCKCQIFFIHGVPIDWVFVNWFVGSGFRLFQDDSNSDPRWWCRFSPSSKLLNHYHGISDSQQNKHVGFENSTVLHGRFQVWFWHTGNTGQVGLLVVARVSDRNVFGQGPLESRLPPLCKGTLW